MLRDAEYHPLTRDIAALRLGSYWAVYDEVLGVEFNMTQRAVLRLALSFFTWRTLVRDGGLENEAAVSAMVDAIRCDGSTDVEDDAS